MLLIVYQPYGNLISNKIKRELFHAVTVTELRNGWTTWTQMKRLGIRLEGNYPTMLRVVFKQISEAVPKTSSCPATYLHSYEASELYEKYMLKKDELISTVLQQTPTHRHGRPIERERKMGVGKSVQSG